jgi:LacI family transcriptional regulator
VRLSDVAAAAGVSQATASRALADSPRISAATRLRVRSAAAHLQYVPNAAARSLRARRTRTLGLVIVDLSDPYHGLVAAGFEIEAGEAGYTVIFVAGLSDPVRERRAMKIFVEHGTDGIALVSSVLDPSEAKSLTRPERLILVEPDHRTLMPGHGELPPGVIRTDDVSGIEAAVDHLVLNGYRDIGYVGAGVIPSNSVRRDSAASRLRHHGIQRPLRRFQAGADGYRAPGTIAARIARDLPEALICYDDKLALALLDGLREQGVRVPEDVALVGFDDIPYASISNPRLTTIVTPTHEMGRLAARALIGAIQTGELPPAIVMPVTLAARESTPPLDRRLRDASAARRARAWSARAASGRGPGGASSTRSIDAPLVAGGAPLA